jgi:alpha-tubulin suppressor-like RCC1 family protein
MSDDGTLLSCGLNSVAQLGREVKDENFGHLFPVTTLPEHEKIIQVALGNSHTLILTEAGRVYSWGEVHVTKDQQSETSENFGPYPVPFDEKVTFIDCGFDFCLVVTISGAVYNWVPTNTQPLDAKGI